MMSNQRCSACDKDQRRTLVGLKQDFYVCDECVRLCMDIMAIEELRPVDKAVLEATETWHPCECGPPSPYEIVLQTAVEGRRQTK